MGLDRLGGHAQGSLLVSVPAGILRQEAARAWRRSIEVLGCAPMLDKYLQAFLQTLAMVGVSAVIAIALGLSLALVLTVTASGGLYPKPRLNRALSITVNTFRAIPFIILLIAIPFIILLIAMLPFTRLLVGTTLAPGRPSCRCRPTWCRSSAHRAGQPERRGPRPGRGRARHGCRRLHIVRHVLLPEALPGIIGGMTVSVIAMINASAMAGAVGAGGLGDLAIRYGYERETRVMFEVIVILIALVSIVQFTGEWLSRRRPQALTRRCGGVCQGRVAGSRLASCCAPSWSCSRTRASTRPGASDSAPGRRRLEQQLSAARDPVGAIVVEQRDHLAEFVEDARFQVPGPVHVAQPRRRHRRRACGSWRRRRCPARISAGMSSSACWLRWR